MLTANDWDNRFNQQAGWTHNLRKYIYSRSGINQLNHIIEIGCGTGAILADFNGDFSHIYGLDISERFLRLAKQKRENTHFSMGDAHYLPFKENSFDAVICHFFLLWVSDPFKVLQEITRIAGKNNPILFLAEPDYKGRIDYPDELEKLGTAQTNSLIKQGADPFIGRRLGSLLSSVGITIVEMGILGGQWELSELDNGMDEEWQILTYDLKFLSDEFENKVIEQTELEMLKKVHQDAKRTGERVLYVPTFYAWGINNK